MYMPNLVESDRSFALWKWRYPQLLCSRNGLVATRLGHRRPLLRSLEGVDCQTMLATRRSSATSATSGACRSSRLCCMRCQGWARSSSSRMASSTPSSTCSQPPPTTLTTPTTSRAEDTMASACLGSLTSPRTPRRAVRPAQHGLLMLLPPAGLPVGPQLHRVWRGELLRVGALHVVLPGHVAVHLHCPAVQQGIVTVVQRLNVVTASIMSIIIGIAGVIIIWRGLLGWDFYERTRISSFNKGLKDVQKYGREDMIAITQGMVKLYTVAAADAAAHQAQAGSAHQAEGSGAHQA